MTKGPDPNTIYPMPGFKRVCYIKNTVRNPNIMVGDYTYYDDEIAPENFERNVLYHYPFIGDRLIIGKFCAIATGVKFIMNGANHKLGGLSTYPFPIFQNGWETHMDPLANMEHRGDTVIGNDVWIGFESVIMPGVQIGDGAVIGAKSVIAKDIPPYAVAVGNPARVIKLRFTEEEIAQLLRIRWWDWDIEKITRNIETIMSGDIARLEACR